LDKMVENKFENLKGSVDWFLREYGIQGLEELTRHVTRDVLTLIGGINRRESAVTFRELWTNYVPAIHNTIILSDSSTKFGPEGLRLFQGSLADSYRRCLEDGYIVLEKGYYQVTGKGRGFYDYQDERMRKELKRLTQL